MADDQKKSNTKKTVFEESWYKATWAHRAWFAAGCATLLFTIAKALRAITAGNGAPLSDPITWLKLTLAAGSGYLLADLGSGIYHWAVDNYGSAATPFFGPQIESFRSHHQYPTEITKCETAGVLSNLAAAVSILFPPVIVLSGDPVLLVFLAAFGGFGMFSLKFHAWAHLPRRKLPRLVAAMQDAGILLWPARHAMHHRPPYNRNFCTVSGVWDGVLDRYGVFAAAEEAVFRAVGVRPRSWAEPGYGWSDNTEHSGFSRKLITLKRSWCAE